MSASRVETSTLPLDDKARAAKAMQASGSAVLDCPISGTAVRMKDRAWTVFCSGDRAAYERVKTMLKVFTDNVPHVGAFGNGMKMKFAANHLVAIYNVACAESVNLARKMRPEDKRLAPMVRRTPLTRSGTTVSVPSTFATGYLYSGMGYTTVFDAAIPPLSARHAHEEFHDTPIVD